MRPFATASFEKYEGLGNDFILVTAERADEVSPAWARAACDRRRGVGADGVLVLLPPVAAPASARMRVINADGSIAEMCGNGLRCAALHLALRRGVSHGEIDIETDAGVRRCGVERNGDEAVIVADMGIVTVLGDVTVEADGEAISLSRVDAGNPHAVTLRPVTSAQFERLGPLLSTAPVFERGANIEFVRLDEGVLDVRVWERGSGATLACGTGACAAVAAASAKGLVPAAEPIRVRLPGGELEIRYARGGRTTMRGPARRVFAGSLSGGAA